MYAIIATGGKQYKVIEKAIVKVERVEGNVGDKINFDQVLMIGNDGEPKVGRPVVDGSKVEGEIVKQGRAPKILVFKKKKRKGYKKIRGHRQCYTSVMIDKIVGA